MAIEIVGQRWKVLAYAESVAATPQDGELYVLSGVPNFEAPRVAVIGDGASTVAQLVAMRQTRPVYAYDDVDTDIPEAGTQVAITEAPNTELYIVVITGDGTHTIAQLVTNFNLNLTHIARNLGVVNVTGNYTVQDGDRLLKVTVADAVTITIPEGLDEDYELIFTRTVASTNAVTAARSGSDTIEGKTSFVVIGAKASSEYDPSESVLRKVATNSWRFVSGIIRGSDSNGDYSIDPSGSCVMRGNKQSASNASATFRLYNLTFPLELADTNYQVLYCEKDLINTRAFVPHMGYISPTTTSVSVNTTEVEANATTGYGNIRWVIHGLWRTA
jgi:hypothetical protein